MRSFMYVLKTDVGLRTWAETGPTQHSRQLNTEIKEAPRSSTPCIVEGADRLKSRAQLLHAGTP